jgi:hypothetical protein
MRRRSWLDAVGALSLTAIAACTNEPVFTPVVTGDFVAPVTAFDPAIDAALWDDTNYNTVVVTTAVAQVAAVPTSPVLPRPLGSLFAALGAVVPRSCLPQVTFVDADQDGIPASYAESFNCTGSPAGTARVTGRVSITDTNDNSPTGGLTVTFNSFVIAVTGAAGVVTARNFDGTISLAPSGNNAFSVVQNLTTIVPSADPATPQLLDTYVSKETATYVADPGISDPFASGTAALDGTGKFTATFNGDNKTEDITRSTDPNLHWNRSCRTTAPGTFGYDAGTLSYKFSDSKRVLLFSGCGAPVQAISQEKP